MLKFPNARQAEGTRLLEKGTPCEFVPTRLWNTGLVSSGASLTSRGEGASLALVGHPCSDGVTIKIPYGVDVLHRPASHPTFSYWVGQSNFVFPVGPVEFCWLWIFPWSKLAWHSCSVWDKPGWLHWFWQFLCERLPSFNPKGF